MKILKTVIIFPCFILLAACTHLNDKFDCPSPHGGSCQRMDEIYDMVNGKNEAQKHLVAAKPQPLSKNSMPLWVAPHKDIDGNYHQAKRIYLNSSESIG